MKQVTSPLRPGDNNDEVNNLKDDLGFLIEQQKIPFNVAEVPLIIRKLKEEVGYKDFTQKMVSTFQRLQQLPPEGVVDENTAKLMNKMLSDLGAFGQAPPAIPGTGIVSGYVYMDYGVPADHVNLNLYSKGFAGVDQPIISTVSEKDGAYMLIYDPAKIQSANFEIRAVDAAGKEYPLSSTLYNMDKTGTITRLNLIVPSEVKPAGESEFSRLGKDIKSVIGDINKIKDASEKEGRQDITFLSQSTNWDARAIAMASLAGKLSDVTKLSHEAAYALVRSGLPTEANQLAQVSSADIEKALALAQKSKIINLDEAQLQKAVTDHAGFANAIRLQTKNFSSLSTYKELLDKKGLAENEQQAFAAVYFAPRKNGAELWQKVKEAGIPDEKIKALKLQGKLGFLTSNNAVLADELQTIVETEDNLSKLVDEGFYEPAKWDEKLKKLANTNDDNADAVDKLIPPAYIGGSVAERKQAYNKDMAAKVREAFPEKVFRNRIETGKIVLGNNVIQKGAATFLNNAEALNFQLGFTHLDSFVKANSAALFNGVAEDQKVAVVESVKLLTRIHQVTPDDESTQLLMELGHKSAYDIVAVPRENFVGRFVKKYSEKYKDISVEKIRNMGNRIYNRSQQVVTTTYSFHTAVKTMHRTPNVPAMSGNLDKQNADQASLDEKLKNYPNLQQLFGPLDFCECEHCHSVLSPAAYFVDLLQMLDRSESDWKYFLDKWEEDHAGEDYAVKYAKPYDALIDRRPDLVNLPLTCENTNTVLPYIDIVNEILEYYLVNEKLKEDLAHDTGGASSAELLAEPQNIQPEAYGILKQSKYPLTLPFDLWIETVRSFCEQYETPLWKLMKTLQPVTGIDFNMQKKIAAEALGLSPAEWSILTNEDPLPSLAELYGYDNDAEMMVALSSAKQLADRLGVTYKELFSLFKTQFINPAMNELELLQKMSVTVNDVFRFKEADKNKFPEFTAEEKKAFQDKLADIQKMYGIDANAAIETAWNKGTFKQVLLLNDSNAACDFEATKAGYALTDALKFDWLKFNLFVRLWRKTGWSIDDLDRSLNVFIPKNLLASVNDQALPEADRAKALGRGLSSGILNMSHLKELVSNINAGKQAIQKLSTLWADIPVAGKNSLYAQLFLSRNVLKTDNVFDDALGNYLSKDLLIKDPAKDHSIAIQSALNMTADDIQRILLENGKNIATAKLTLPNISLLGRYSILAKGLKLSIAELLYLKQLTGLDPFATLQADPIDSEATDVFLNQTLKFVNCALKLKESQYKLEDVTYLFFHKFDTKGKYRSVADNAGSVVKLLADEFNRIRTEHAVPSNPDDANDLSPMGTFTNDILQQKLSLVIPPGNVQVFMGMWLDPKTNNWELVKDTFSDFISKDQFNSLFVEDAIDADDAVKQKNLLQKRALLAGKLLPFIQQKLITQSVIQLLAGATGSDPVRIEWLLSDAKRLHDPAQAAVPLSAIFAQASDLSKADSVKNAYLLLGKVILLAESFKLTDKELQYFIGKSQDFGNMDLSAMPVLETNVPGTAQALFASFLRIADYVKLRDDISNGSDDIIDVFSNARLQYDVGPNNAANQAKQVDALFIQIADMTRREKDTISLAAAAIDITATTQVANNKFMVNVDAFADERAIILLWNALKLIQVFGIPVDTLQSVIEITNSGLTEEKYQAIAENMKNAVKARYEIEAWQQVAQPVFDKLRQRRRDALVAYLLHKFRDLFTSIEEMYEYFLVDPGTEPVVQTSRIRIATSSIQLFIQRCLLNLETRWTKKVPAAAINSKLWEWMNRYRVWEANRKIFLWPENWLEPEWRDDKTHLFQELEGKLLQGDVSNELVEEGFFVYLKKLEEMARLEITTVHYQEETDPSGNTLHVIARTYGSPHKYFYRRYAQKMWTPWEPVDAEIDGDHLVLIKWRERMHLFWVTFIEKAIKTSPTVSDSDTTTTLSSWKISDALKTVKGGSDLKTVEAHLHWSDYYQGKWSSKQSGGIDNVISSDISVSSKTSDINISIKKDTGTIVDGVDGAVIVSLSLLNKAFKLENKNSPASEAGFVSAPTWPYRGTYQINRFNIASSVFSVVYPSKVVTLNNEITEVKNDPQVIFGKTSGKANLVFSNKPVIACETDKEKDKESDADPVVEQELFGPLVTPFFYQDSWNTFYIEPELKQKQTINDWDEWVGGKPEVFQPPRVYIEKPPVLQPIFPWPVDVRIPMSKEDPAWLDMSSNVLKVNPLVRNDWMTGADTYVKFDERVMGANAGMNVVLFNSKSASPQIITNSNDLNTVIHGTGSLANIGLVPANNSGIATTNGNVNVGNTAITGAATTNAGVVALGTGITLAGGAGIAVLSGNAANIGNAAHLGGMFGNVAVPGNIANHLNSVNHF